MEIDERKLIDYALSPTHLTGKHKARRFATKLGLQREDAPAMIEALSAAAAWEEATPKEHDGWGQRYSIDFLFRFGPRSAMITSGWIVPADGSRPRLTSVYIAREK